MNMLGQALSSLKQLATLVLHRVTCLSATWPQCLKLLDLEIVSCHRFRSSKLDTLRFVNAFAPNLHRLKLDCLEPRRNNPAEDATGLERHHRFHLPRLVEFDIFHTRVYPLIYCFKDCAQLQRIHYQASHRKEFFSFVELICASFWPQLEELHVRLEHYDREEERARNLDKYRTKHDKYINPQGSYRNHHGKYRNQLTDFCHQQDIRFFLILF